MAYRRHAHSLAWVAVGSGRGLYLLWPMDLALTVGRLLAGGESHVYPIAVVLGGSAAGMCVKVAKLSWHYAFTAVGIAKGCLCLRCTSVLDTRRSDRTRDLIDSTVASKGRASLGQCTIRNSLLFCVPLLGVVVWRFVARAMVSMSEPRGHLRALESMGHAKTKSSASRRHRR